jgi:microcystin degradation protein MlrC
VARAAVARQKLCDAADAAGGFPPQLAAALPVDAVVLGLHGAMVRRSLTTEMK